MNRKSLLVLGFSAVLLVGLAASAAAQNVTLAYQYMHVGDCDGCENFNTGIDGEVAFPLGGAPIEGVVDFDWSRHSESEGHINLTNFGAGVRWTSMKNPKIKPFLQGIIGMTHVTCCGSSDSNENDSENDFAIGGDAGIMAPISGGKVSIVFSVGYRHIAAQDDAVDGVRVVAGVNIPLKKK